MNAATKDPIVQAGSKVLRERAKPVPKKDFGSRKLTSLLKKMSQALSPEENGVALAAPQVGQPLRVFIVAGRVFSKEKNGDAADTPADKVFINPQFLRLSRAKSDMSEGCLSVRGVYGMVARHDKASVKAFNERGEAFTYHGSGLLAQIFQHEMDHLDGILFIDKAQKLERPEAQKDE